MLNFTHYWHLLFLFCDLCLVLWQSHSLRCTESFMKENVVEELQQLQPDNETKQKMLDILKRFHEEEETDSMDEDGMLFLPSAFLDDAHFYICLSFTD